MKPCMQYRLQNFFKKATKGQKWHVLIELTAVSSVKPQKLEVQPMIQDDEVLLLFINYVIIYFSI